MNGPGICLANFYRIIKNYHDVTIYTELSCNDSEVNSIKNTSKVKLDIKAADLVIHWSGLTAPLIKLIVAADDLHKKIWLGPNLIDGVSFLKEKEYLQQISFDKILTVNNRLKFMLSKIHKINLEKLTTFIIGPDINLWCPIDECDDTILWKGNSTQYVKDISFGLQLQKKLQHKYAFKFLGYPKPYDYLTHIPEAKKSKLLICTSLSETTGQVVLESWSCGIPSVTHPKIYMHGINYQTGIIISKTLEDYSSAIEEIMDNTALYQEMKIQSRRFMELNFSDQNIANEFNKMLI